jgi:hypothetical protein
MATEVSSQKTFTPLFALQIFAVVIIGAVVVLTIYMVALKSYYQWEAFTLGSATYSPVYAIAAASACLVLSFFIPEYLLDSARRELKREDPNSQTEDLPFIFVPSIFIRYALLAIVTMIGFIMSYSGQGLSLYLPFALISLVLMVAYFPTESRMKAWLYSRLI